MTSLIGCNTKIVAGIFEMLNFMIISLQQLATTCKALLFYFIAARPYNKIIHSCKLFYFILAVLFYLYGGLKLPDGPAATDLSEDISLFTGYLIEYAYLQFHG